MGGWPGARVMVDNVLWKPPATRPLGYHQDSAYLAWYTPSDLLSLWIALDDTPAEGGTLEFVRGRSEEHTSELQSLLRTSYAVSCLNKQNNFIRTSYTPSPYS